MSHTEQTAEQIAAASDQVHTGLQRLLALATPTADAAPHLAVLRALWAPGGESRHTVVQELADILDTMSVSLSGADDPRAELAAEILVNAHDVLEDSVGGDHVERAQRLLAEVAEDAGSDQAEEYAEDLEAIRYTADVVCVREGDVPAVLMIRRRWAPHESLLALPGGHIDKGETSLDGAVRELAEETSVQVSPFDLGLVGVFDGPNRDPRGRYVSVAYLVTVPAGTEAVAGDDAAEVDWVPLADLPDELAFDHADIVSAALRALR
ncbi:NUDIX domain-containing protein [Kitasatospora sp. NPDC059160]|uniref:NUDIX domain-containing protein n=1 Tax=Kitasatospora sp. NPDC059160 TaxID=3346748 RepID=UPI0036CCAE7A